MIPFNEPYITGNELNFIADACKSGKISGNGAYTQNCQLFFEQKYNFKKCLLTSSCTDALEMASILIDSGPGDEIIIPSYTFVSSANPFILRGAKVLFADSSLESPNVDVLSIERLITPKTKAIVVVHYAGIACDMDAIMSIASKYNLYVIEDAAQSIDNFFIDKSGNKIPLGSIGHMSAFSFHETKNIISGEGGMLVINDEKFIKRAEIIWEKGTNRAEFYRGEVNKYGWVDIGSSFLPSELTAAFLFAQLQDLNLIQNARLKIWNTYYDNFKPLELEGKLRLPFIPEYSTNNGHIFYLILKNIEERDAFIYFLKENGINAVFHYLSLNRSSFYLSSNEEVELFNSEFYSNCLVRLPLFVNLSESDIIHIIKKVKEFFEKPIG
jgi:dTDP-4-amino-4,6-dideoxygalactose transaminase